MLYAAHVGQILVEHPASEHPRPDKGRGRSPSNKQVPKPYNISSLSLKVLFGFLGAHSYVRQELMEQDLEILKNQKLDLFCTSFASCTCYFLYVIPQILFAIVPHSTIRFTKPGNALHSRGQEVPIEQDVAKYKPHRLNTCFGHVQLGCQFTFQILGFYFLD